MQLLDWVTFFFCGGLSAIGLGVLVFIASIFNDSAGPGFTWYALLDDFKNPSVFLRGPLGIALYLFMSGAVAVTIAGVLWIMEIVI